MIMKYVNTVEKKRSLSYLIYCDDHYDDLKYVNTVEKKKFMI